MDVFQNIDLLKLLRIAVKKGHVSILKRLQREEKLAEIISGDLGTDLLSGSCLQNNVVMVKMLLDLGVKTMYEDLDAQQPLMYCKSAEVTKLLLENGAIINHSCESEYTKLKIISALSEAV